MTRKSKQASGNAVVTHYELRHKLTGEHGTQERRLAGHAQYQLGDCGLSLTPLVDATTVLCSPSGYLYEDQAILQYLVTQTQLLKDQKEKADAAAAASAAKNEPDPDAKRKAAFDASQNDWAKKKQKTNNNNTGIVMADVTLAAAKKDLKRTSYWLADSQPILEQPEVKAPTSQRPPSPHSQEPLRRKDLWPVELEFSKPHDGKQQLLCSLTGKPIRGQAAVAYWTNSSGGEKDDGHIVLKDDAWEQLIVQPAKQDDDNNQKETTKKKKKKKTKKTTYFCPKTNQKIKHTRDLQRSGTSFATSGQDVVVQNYRPTMT